MKRTWLIGAALVFSLTALGCSDDDDDTDGTHKPDAGDAGGGAIDAGHLDGSIDSAVPGSDAGDAGDAG
jgi:hypothetical protein